MIHLQHLSITMAKTKSSGQNTLEAIKFERLQRIRTGTCVMPCVMARAWDSTDWRMEAITTRQPFPPFSRMTLVAVY